MTEQKNTLLGKSKLEQMGIIIQLISNVIEAHINFLKQKIKEAPSNAEKKGYEQGYRAAIKKHGFSPKKTIATLATLSRSNVISKDILEIITYIVSFDNFIKSIPSCNKKPSNKTAIAVCKSLDDNPILYLIDGISQYRAWLIIICSENKFANARLPALVAFRSQFKDKTKRKEVKLLLSQTEGRKKGAKKGLKKIKKTTRNRIKDIKDTWRDVLQNHPNKSKVEIAPIVQKELIENFKSTRGFSLKTINKYRP